jgi:hypothetical protein
MKLGRAAAGSRMAMRPGTDAACARMPSTGHTGMGPEDPRVSTTRRLVKVVAMGEGVWRWVPDWVRDQALFGVADSRRRRVCTVVTVSPS